MKNRVALVTGAGRGIGRAIALSLAHDGYDVIINYHKDRAAADQLARLITELGREAWVIRADLSRDEQVVNIAKKIGQHTDHLDVLVNNAGFDYAKRIEEYTLSEMRYVIDIVLFAKMSVTKSVLPLLKKSGAASIINIASRMGKEKTITTIGAYGPAEAGVIKFTQCCALEFAPDNIRVNCVAPGLVKTDLTRSILSEEDFTYAAKIIPSSRIGRPIDIANVVSFLVSEKAEYINGETIGVNGGSNLG